MPASKIFLVGTENFGKYEENPIRVVEMCWAIFIFFLFFAGRIGTQCRNVVIKASLHVQISSFHTSRNQDEPFSPSDNNFSLRVSLSSEQERRKDIIENWVNTVTRDRQEEDSDSVHRQLNSMDSRFIKKKTKTCFCIIQWSWFDRVNEKTMSEWCLVTKYFHGFLKVACQRPLRIVQLLSCNQSKLAWGISVNSGENDYEISEKKNRMLLSSVIMKSSLNRCKRLCLLFSGHSQSCYDFQTISRRRFKSRVFIYL